MIHTLKKGTLILSNWIQDSRGNWMKHRLGDYSEPMDSIKIQKDFLNFQLIWKVVFYGPNVEYIEYVYRRIYGDPDIPLDKLEETKKQIDSLLTKVDKLIIFS